MSTEKIIFATGNPNKVREINAICPPHLHFVSLREVGIEMDIPEDFETLEENAVFKAKTIKDLYGFDCIAEDTGLEADALNGEPGVHTARYAGPEKNADKNMEKLLTELSHKKTRTAQFRTVIALIRQNKTYTFEGICRGRIALQKMGTGGFGYDPIFIPDGYEESFGVLDAAVKHKISHRAKAFEQLLDFLNRVSGK